MDRIVLTVCPETAELVPTGFVALTLDELEPVNSLVNCPACGDDHEWVPLDAVLAAE
jgi:hypothetical protein